MAMLINIIYPLADCLADILCFLNPVSILSLCNMPLLPIFHGRDARPIC